MSVQDYAGSEGNGRPPATYRSRIALVFAGFTVIAGILLFTEHRAHVLGFLVWLPILACPLMHLFMHHGHGHHHADDQQNGRKNE